MGTKTSCSEMLLQCFWANIYKTLFKMLLECVIWTVYQIFNDGCFLNVSSEISSF